MMKRWQYAIIAIWMCLLLIIGTDNENAIAKYLSQSQSVGGVDLFSLGRGSANAERLPYLRQANSQQQKENPLQWTELPAAKKIDKSRSIDLDFTYATTNNFVNTKLYPCPRCFLRTDVATAIQTAHQQLQQQGYGGLRMFDCYRPQPIQQQMWAIKPDVRYVANPTKGSDHNRGIAVDLTILDHNGKPLDMGTVFNEFSPKSHHTYLELSPEVLKNRSLLKTTMASVGLRHINTEWWHYAWKENKPPVGKWVWDCN